MPSDRIDIHAHVVVELPDFADSLGDRRWPAFTIDDGVGNLWRGGRVVRTLPPSAWSADARLADMDQAGLDRQVISPVPPIICDWADPDNATEWTRRLNAGIAAMCAAHPARLDGLGTVPLQHPDRAVAVLAEAKQLGLVGVEIGTVAGGRELDHKDLREFFQAAGELGMLVFVHPLLLGTTVEWTDRIAGLELAFGLAMTTDTAIAATKLVFGGTMQASPGLSVCLAHGGGTFAWSLARIRRLWDARQDVPVSELIGNVYVDSVVFEPKNLDFLIAELGAERVLFGTDYPLPGSDSLTGSILSHLEGEVRHLVGGGNCAALLTKRNA